jgi:MerR family transcriptional regulator, copper efflux regulator
VALTIGEIAKRCGVGVETIRFYERKGLIAQPSRPESGFRRYPPDVMSRVRFIQRSKALGFSLREIKELLFLRVDASTSCAEVKKRAQEKMAEIETKIASLSVMNQALSRLTKACRGRGPTGECPILEALGEWTEPLRNGTKRP